MTKRIVLLTCFAVILSVFLVFAPTAGAGLNTGTGLWEWVSPGVQGNALNGMKMLNANTGWAVGMNGLVLKTNNGGDSWTVQNPGIPFDANNNFNYYGVDFVDASNGWVVGNLGLFGSTVVRTTNGGASWVAQSLPAGSTTAILTDVDFVNASWGVAVGSGKAYYTTNGGASWVAATGITPSHNLERVQMLDATTGYTVGSTGSIYKTINGGVTWQAQTSGVTHGLNGLYFTDASNGIVVGAEGGPAANGRVLVTNNGGANWSADTLGTMGTPLKDVAVNGSTILAAGYDGNVFGYVGSLSSPPDTISAGLNSSARFSGSSSLLYDIEFATASTVYVTGDAGVFSKSTNTGGTWQLKAGGEPRNLNTSDFLNADTGWVGGDDGTVMKTADGGTNWSDASGTLPATFHVYDIDFLSNDEGVAVGCEGASCPNSGTGRAYRYFSGSWSAMTVPGGVTALRSVRMTSPANGWAVGDDGKMLRTTDGTNWIEAGSPLVDPKYDFYGVDSTNAAANGWAVGWNSATFKAVEARWNGTQWVVSTDYPNGFFLDIDMVNASTGYLSGSSGTLYKTTNGGVNWNLQTTGTSKVLAGVSFMNSNVGMAAGEDGRIISTANGGAAWTIEDSGTTVSLYSASVLASGSNYRTFVTGGNSAVLRNQDTTPPAVTDVQPSGSINTTSTTLSASYSDDLSGIDTASVAVTLDGNPVSGCTVSASSVSCPVSGLALGPHSFNVSVSDLSGKPGSAPGSFSVMTTRSYYFTWYDNVGGSNWVLMANPNSASGNLSFDLSIGGVQRSLAAFNNGNVAPGSSITPAYEGVVGGPVKVNSQTGGKAIVSQRILWPKGGNSIEEVLGIDAARLSSHFYWTWYDGTGGFKNWVLVANPNTHGVFYRIKLGGNPISSGTIGPGQSVQPMFPGTIGGPVEVEAWTSAAMTTPANVFASQRVLSNGDTAFNEQVGIPVEELSSSYLWTWYDNTSPGARNWVLVANPPGSSPIYYEIWIAGEFVCSDQNCLGNGGGGANWAPGAIPGGSKVTPLFPRQNGPVEVKTFSNAAHTVPANSIASQRILWGPSFGETPGYPESALSSSYHWTWYDETSPSVSNWVLIANPSTTQAVNYVVKVGGVTRASGSLAPGARVTPDFRGLVGGPVEVTSTGGPVMASQRVLWNGYFNEVLGTVLN
jgi:photosystem II stability/assembly factor-like uncharacterized protein